MKKIPSLSRKTYRRIVDEYEIRTVVSDGLSDLLRRECLLFFRFAADQNDRLRIANVLMSSERNTQVIEKRSKIVFIRNCKILGSNNLLRKSPKSEDRFI